MTTTLVTIQYGFTTEDKVTHKMYLQSGDTADHTGGDGVETLDGTYVPADLQPIANARIYIVNYLSCLREICQPNIQILSATAEQFSETDWGSHVVIHTATVDVVDFTPRTGNTAGAGPRGRAFIAGRQKIPATNRAGWMRFHYISGHLMSSPTFPNYSTMPGQFADFYDNLRNLVSPLEGYATLTGALGTELEVTPKGLPSTVLHFGIRNG